jgi:hypothetical protein
VIHLVPGRGLEHAKQVRRESGTERVGAERTGGDGHESGRGPQAEEEPVHPGYLAAASSAGVAGRSAHAPSAPMSSRKPTSPRPMAVMLGGGGPSKDAA